MTWKERERDEGRVCAFGHSQITSAEFSLPLVSIRDLLHLVQIRPTTPPPPTPLLTSFVNGSFCREQESAGRDFPANLQTPKKRSAVMVA